MARLGDFIGLGLVLGALVACKLSAGGDDVRASVNCEGTNDSINCDVKHESGSRGANVCWDLSFSCANGASVTGQNFCQTVDPNSTAQRRIPLSELNQADSCDKATSSEVKNLRITAR